MVHILIFLSLFFNISNNGYKVGDYADDFYLENVDGNFVSLSDYSDALGFIIVFTCNTCPYSIAYATRTPHVYILEKVSEGNIVRYIGAIDDSSRNPEKVRTKYVENAIDSLLEGVLPKTNSTKAIGCSIKTL